MKYCHQTTIFHSNENKTESCSGFWICHLTHTAHSAQIWWIFLPAACTPPALQNGSHFYSNFNFQWIMVVCWLYIYHEFIIRFVWTNTYLRLLCSVTVCPSKQSQTFRFQKFWMEIICHIQIVPKSLLLAKQWPSCRSPCKWKKSKS